jgi:hypothetical protein
MAGRGPLDERHAPPTPREGERGAGAEHPGADDEGTGMIRVGHVQTSGLAFVS